MIGRIARGGLAAALALAVAALAGCATAITGTAEPVSGVGSSSTSASASASAGPITPFDGTKTPPGATLKIGEPAIVDLKGSKGIGQIKITPTVIEKGAIADLADFKLKDEDKTKTPFYMRVSTEYLGGADLSSESVKVRLDGIDDRGQRHGSVSLLGTFKKCESNSSPRGWSKGQPFQTCIVFMLGGGELTGARYSEFGTPYRDGPVTWTK